MTRVKIKNKRNNHEQTKLHSNEQMFFKNYVTTFMVRFISKRTGAL